MARKCRDVAGHAVILHPIPRLGGPGVIIQIDESKFNHKSEMSKKGLNTSDQNILSYKRSGQPENVFGSDNENVLNAPKTGKIHTRGIVRVTCLRTD
ncbi:hypothetical protein pdam_00021790 [Pocillopora damicornis]|uniref:Uncharacterized protein n=1 Tax=Pocillopora damicornis TaxID=46731 RepID=A0A3M6UNQ8_POCDA|nr:hypothetical protein pdam_00021790 [Pocillopora damicornis]